LSIFDRAISPTSLTLLVSNLPSPGTPSCLHLTFLRSATPSIDDEWESLSPTFLSPRSPPAVPSRTPQILERNICKTNDMDRLGQSKLITLTSEESSVDSKPMDTPGSRWKVDISHCITASRATATRCLAKPWKKLFPRRRNQAGTR
jgi:hypothetical protein